MWVYLFEEGNTRLRSLLGGKGADLAEMTRIGLPVPPGITITTEACKKYNTMKQRFPDGLEKEVLEKIKHIEKKMGKKFGDPSDPLLVSVRSGAPVSMPGMMDTILNLGLNDITVKGLAKATNDERVAYDCYRRLIEMFGNVVLDIKRDKFERILEEYKHKLDAKLDLDLDAEALKEIAEEYKKLIKIEIGKDFPQEPYQQLFMAIRAVFDSWNNPRAIVYRKVNKISNDLGTAVNIQAMVFGNRGLDSGTGVAFTRNPATGEKELYGEYLMNAQGEDVVAGIRTPKSIDQLKAEAPHIYKELQRTCDLLERHYKDIQDIEFTIENDVFYMLQTRSGKRTAQAAVKIAVDMAKEGLISKEEALMRIEPKQIERLLHRRIDPNAEIELIAKGLPASPGAASGIVIFDVDEADKRGSAGEKVILVRMETTPEDIHGMVAAQGILTSRGGMTSHAAVVARGMGKPCVSGAGEVKIDSEAEKFMVGDITIEKGDIITIDGSRGYIIKGEVPTIEPELSPEIRELLGWTDEIRTLGVRTNADTPEGAERARMFGAEGIGLCRTERMFNAQDRLPIVQEMIMANTEEDRKIALNKLLPMQRGDFNEIFKIMDGLPVTIRLLDLPLHEFLPRLEDLLVETTELRLSGKDEEAFLKKTNVLKKVQTLNEHNPMLGHRGCRLGIRYPEIYEMQTRAIFEAATELAKENISVKLEIMLPLVGKASEISFLRQRIEDVAKRVMEEAGLKLEYMIGTMIEVPRAALTADEMARYAEFFSFGTNDLTQTVFGYSRDDAEAKFLYNYLNENILEANPFETLDREGVGKIMKICVDFGRKTRHDIEIGICGEHGGDPASVEFCHEIGLDYVSCSPFRVPIARFAAAQAKIKMDRSSANDSKVRFEQIDQ
ncbi:MAG: pyruvate, phosphate dikinase [Candidatus Methylarchaceae archaeon HK01M]|nr:pyruvate, phosphate dikinase [Candidatus Methylarchaceae archaeon HK01M]